MSRLSTFLKNSLYLLFFLLIAPQIIVTLSKQYSALLTPSTKVGILSFTHSLTNAGEYVRNLKKFFKEPSIKAILLRMDCPGGTAGTSQAIYNELVSLKQQYPHKPVVVFIENVCASGAYYVACPCDWIVSTGSAFVGSIGVYLAVPRLNEFISQFKVNYSVTKTGKYKTILNPLLPPVEGEQELLQELCDDTYQQFVEDVAKSRPALNLKEANNWANGKIFTGRQALEMKLIDQIGSLTQVEQQLRERAHIPDSQEIQWVKADQKNLIMRILSPDDSGEANDDLSLARFIKTVFMDYGFCSAL